MDEQEAGLPKFPQPESELPNTHVVPQQADAYTAGNWQPQVKKPNILMRIGIATLIATPLIAFSPIIYALIGVRSCPGGAAAANEGNCAAAAAPWLLFMTVPLGFVLGVAGLAMVIIASRKR